MFKTFFYKLLTNMSRSPRMKVFMSFITNNSNDSLWVSFLLIQNTCNTHDTPCRQIIRVKFRVILQITVLFTFCRLMLKDLDLLNASFAKLPFVKRFIELIRYNFEYTLDLPFFIMLKSEKFKLSSWPSPFSFLGWNNFSYWRKMLLLLKKHPLVIK